MTELTITEALAEMKTIDKRIEKKNDYILNYLIREEDRRDPLDSEGGSVTVIAREKQAINDLLERKVKIRMIINRINADILLTVGGVTRSIAEWIVWRRDAAPILRDLLTEQSRRIRAARTRDVQTANVRRTASGLTSKVEEPRAVDIVVNVPEGELATQIENLEQTLGSLDGQLSLKNATVLVEL